MILRAKVIPSQNLNSFLVNRSQNIPSLNHVRGAACLLVVFAHAGWHGLFFDVRGMGALGVMLFFSLSGFLMEHHYGNLDFSIKKWIAYFINRGCRVYPLFFCILTISYLAYTHFEHVIYPINFDDFLEHLTLQYGESVLWTIPVEIKFYLYFPAVVLFARFTQGNDKYKILLYSFIFIFSMYLSESIRPDKINSLAYFCFFIGGMWAASIYQTIQYSHHQYNKFNALGCILLVIIFISFTPVFYENIFNIKRASWDNRSILAVIASLIVLMIAFKEISNNFISRVFSYTGTISYSLYLIHLPVFSVILSFFESYPTAIKSIFILIAVYLIASVSYFTIEVPFRKLGKNFITKLS